MKRLILVLLLMHILSLQAIGAPCLRIEMASEEEIKGTYNVLLYGGRHGNDFETIAYLDPVGDGFEIAVNTPEFNYRAETLKDAKEALRIAKTFVGWHSSFKGYSIGKILTPEGKVAGYEVRPLYMPFDYGRSDVFDNSYWLRGNKVVISIRLQTSVERYIYGIDSSKEND